MHQFEEDFFLQRFDHVFAQIQLLQAGQFAQERGHSRQLWFSDFEVSQLQALGQSFRNGASFVDWQFLEWPAKDMWGHLFELQIADLSSGAIGEGSDRCKGYLISAQMLIEKLGAGA